MPRPASQAAEQRVYIFFSVYEPLYHKLSEELAQRHPEARFGGFVNGLDQAEYLQATGFPWWRLDVHSDWLRAFPPGPADTAYLAEVEARYGLTLARLVLTDAYTSSLPHAEVLRVCEAVFRHFEELCDADRPDAVLFQCFNGLPALALQAVASARGIPCVSLDTGRFRDRTIVHGDPLQRWAQVGPAFAARATGPLSPEERAAAERFIQEFRAHKPKPQNQFLGMEVKGSDFSRLLTVWRKHRSDPQNVTLLGPGAMLAQRLRRRRWYRQAVRANLFQAAVPGEPYVLYPLHFQPEASTLVCAPYYVDQLSLIEDLAKSLPVGYRLYVKEHPASIGRRPVEYYRRLAAIWNVHLVDPHSDSFGMVAGASAVVTITGTMGWEALVCGKPVVTFGEVFYNTCPLVVRAGLAPKERWAALLRQVLQGPPPDEEVLVRYIATLLSVTTPGFLLVDNPWTRPEVLTEKNIKSIADRVEGPLGFAHGGRVVPPTAQRALPLEEPLAPGGPSAGEAP